MANISRNLSMIAAAVYGSEMRSAIYDAIREMNNETGFMAEQIQSVQACIDADIFGELVARTLSGSIQTGAGVLQVGSWAFADCIGLTEASFPAVTDIYEHAFERCSSLTRVDLPAIAGIGSFAFAGCSALESVYMSVESVPTLSHSNAFWQCPVVSFYVPSSLYGAFCSASNWGYFSSQFVSI